MMESLFSLDGDELAPAAPPPDATVYRVPTLVPGRKRSYTFTTDDEIEAIGDWVVSPFAIARRDFYVGDAAGSLGDATPDAVRAIFRATWGRPVVVTRRALFPMRVSTRRGGQATDVALMLCADDVQGALVAMTSNPPFRMVLDTSTGRLADALDPADRGLVASPVLMMWDYPRAYREGLLSYLVAAVDVAAGGPASSLPAPTGDDMWDAAARRPKAALKWMKKHFPLP